MIWPLRLTPRQTLLARDLIVAGMIVSVAVALAGLTWRLAGHAGTGAITIPSGARPVAVPPDLGPALALAPFGKPAFAEAAQPTGLPVVLRGVIFAVPASLSTAFISVDGEAPKPFRVGESVSGATIETIQRDRVLLNNGGRIEALAFPTPSAAPTDTAGTAPPPSQDGSPPGAPAVPPGATSVLQRLDATPVENGYRVGERAPPGLQPGDIVEAVNGATLGDPGEDSAVLADAARSGTARVQIVRDGNPITLTIPFR